MKQLKVLITLLSMTAMTLSCSKKEEDLEATKIEPGTQVAGSCTTDEKGVLSGSCTYRFNTIATAATESTGVNARFGLIDNDSKVSVVINSTKPDLTDGLIISFERDGNFVNVFVEINALGRSKVRIERVRTIDPNAVAVMATSVVNSTSTRLLLWETKVNSYTVDTSFLDTARTTTDLESPLVSVPLVGLYRGFILHRANVQKIVIEAPHAP